MSPAYHMTFPRSGNWGVSGDSLRGGPGAGEHAGDGATKGIWRDISIV
jgi:hypothetical protein